MKGAKLTNQQGFSFIEIMLALLIVASITAYVSVKSSSQREQANDVISRVASEDIKSAARNCIDQYSGAPSIESVSSSSSSEPQQVVVCDTGSSSAIELLTLPERVEGSIDNDWVAARHLNGTSSSSSSGDRTTFCVNRNSSEKSVTSTNSLSVDSNNCPGN